MVILFNSSRAKIKKERKCSLFQLKKLKSKTKTPFVTRFHKIKNKMIEGESIIYLQN